MPETKSASAGERNAIIQVTILIVIETAIIAIGTEIIVTEEIGKIDTEIETAIAIEIEIEIETGACGL